MLSISPDNSLNFRVNLTEKLHLKYKSNANFQILLKINCKIRKSKKI